MYMIDKIFNPDVYQGRFKKRNYFEGWYFKLIDGKKENILAVIPGISLGNTGLDSHAFIQLADAVKSKNYYFKYDISSFKYSKSYFDVCIGENTFNGKGLKLSLRNKDISAEGELHFYNIIPFPKSYMSPGIMGPYSFVPFMECYHGIINIHHEIEGYIKTNGTLVDFSGGYGYIEKDWGRSFPESWIWFQSNHFNQGDVSVMFSIAKIPWFGRYFTGFISFIRIGNRILKLASYTGCRICGLKYEDGTVSVVIKGREYSLHMIASYNRGNPLKAPRDGIMKRDITESITSTVHVSLWDKQGNLIFMGDGEDTGMEIAGDISQLIKNY